MSRRRPIALPSILALSLALLGLVATPAQAQSRRARRDQNQANQAPSTNYNTQDPLQAAFQQAVVQQNANQFTLGAVATPANASAPAVVAPTGRQTQGQINEDWAAYVRSHPRQMWFINQQTGGFPVMGGMYLPGYGVVNGSMFGGPNTAGLSVRGGLYLPGYGVINGQGIDGGTTAGQTVAGGTYLPGFGVVGGPLVNGSTAAGGPDVANISGPALGNLAVGPVFPSYGNGLGNIDNSYGGAGVLPSYYGGAGASTSYYSGAGVLPTYGTSGLPSVGGPAVGGYAGPYLPSYAPLSTSLGGPATPGLGGPAAVGNQTGPAVLGGNR